MEQYLFASTLVCGLLLAAWVVTRRAASTQARGDSGSRQIPQPFTLPLVGNIFSLDMAKPLTSMLDLRRRYPQCFRLSLPGLSVVVINSHRLTRLVSDERIFAKEPLGPLLEARNGAGDGLFTAYSSEVNWATAHGILKPVFGRAAVREMLQDMIDVGLLLVDKWAGAKGGRPLDPMDDLESMSYDMIALCAFNNQPEALRDDSASSFYKDMFFFLQESGDRSMRPPVVSRLLLWSRTNRYWSAIKNIQGWAEKIVAKRMGAGCSAKGDVLDAMLFSADAKTGRKLPRQNIINNTLTLLGAGSQTTAGMIGFLLALLLKHDTCLQEARQEIDQVLGSSTIQVEHLDRLQYLLACIRETLRLYPNAPGYQVKLLPSADAQKRLNVGYQLDEDDIVTINLMALHRDPDVYGPDADCFRPERMAQGSFEKVPRHAWKPFGNGVRGCIGQEFAIQEALVVCALILQRFDLRLVDPDYTIRIAEGLTLKPQNLSIVFTLREKYAPS